MTKKDYIKLAAALKAVQPVADGSEAQAPIVTQWVHDVLAVADVLAGDNGTFDRTRFLKAAGVL